MFQNELGKFRGFVLVDRYIQLAVALDHLGQSTTGFRRPDTGFFRLRLGLQEIQK